MYTNKQICEKIRAMYPEVGACGIDINVEYSKKNTAWIVDLKKGGRQLRTFLEPEDANVCMEGKQCIGMGLQIHQLKDNIKNLSRS